MAKTASGLVSFVSSKIGTNYIYGMSGTVMTASMYTSLKNKYGANVWDSDINKVGTVCTDCSGLISWYTGSRKSSSTYKSSATTILPISAIDKAVPGCALWRSGHIGVYIGNGYLIEAKGSKENTVKSQVSKRDFTHILWLSDIEYDTTSSSGSISTSGDPSKYTNSTITTNSSISIGTNSLDGMTLGEIQKKMNAKYANAPDVVKARAKRLQALISSSNSILKQMMASEYAENEFSTSTGKTI